MAFDWLFRHLFPVYENKKQATCEDSICSVSGQKTHDMHINLTQKSSHDSVCLTDRLSSLDRVKHKPIYRINLLAVLLKVMIKTRMRDWRPDIDFT